MQDRGFHSLPLCISHIIRATPKTKSLVKSLHDKYRTLPSHGSVTCLSEICSLICRDEVLDLMFIPPNYWDTLSKRTVFPCMSSCLRYSEVHILPPMGGSQGTLLSLEDWLVSESSLQVCLHQSKYFALNQQIMLSFFQIVEIGAVIITRII